MWENWKARKEKKEEDTLQSPGEKLEILAYLLQQHERQSNGYTLYNEQRNPLAWGQLWGGERERVRQRGREKERENQMKLTHEHLDYRPGGRWRINSVLLIQAN